MYCNKCGKEIDSDSKFCPYCGDKIQTPKKSIALPSLTWKKNKRDYFFIFILFIVAIITFFLFFYFNLSNNEEINYTSEETETEEAVIPINPGIHNYEFINSPMSFNEAVVAAKEKDGYLLHIDTQEEYNLINNKLEERYQNGDPTTRYYIGGRRYSDAGYKWIDQDGNTYGEIINKINFWFPGEPSFRDENNLDREEDVLSIMRDSGNWLVNDVTEDINAVYDEFKGKTGYIIEYKK